MKCIVLGVFLSAILSVAQAGTLEIASYSNIVFSDYDGEPLSVTGAQSSGNWGSLVTTSAGTFSATYLGNESGYTNNFSFGAGYGSLLESSVLGDTISKLVGVGAVGFSFSDDAGSSGHSFANGSQQTKPLGFAILNGQTNSYGTFDYLLGFNDSYTGDADYDDFVVGVKFVSVSEVSQLATHAVPEPATYALLLTGLGLIGFSTRRRKNDNLMKLNLV